MKTSFRLGPHGMLSERHMLSGTTKASASKDALLLSFKAFDVAIAAALQSDLPLTEWFRCALIHAADKAQEAGGDEIAVGQRPSNAVVLHREQNTVSHNDPSTVLLKQAGSALEAAQKRIDGLCDALQGLINLSDSKRVTDLAEVKRS